MFIDRQRIEKGFDIRCAEIHIQFECICYVLGILLNIFYKPLHVDVVYQYDGNRHDDTHDRYHHACELAAYIFVYKQYGSLPYFSHAIPPLPLPVRHL